MNDRRLKSLEAARSALAAKTDASLRVPCYCEENVWRLAYREICNQESETTQNRKYFVAFVSNPKACVPMFEQLAAYDRKRPVMWDYHVVLLMTRTISEDLEASKTFVMDIDSHLQSPCALEEYVEKVFPNSSEWVKDYLPYFRVIDASVYLRHFSSDRSHMFDFKTRTWNAPPPPYDCILLLKDSTLPTLDKNENIDTVNTLKNYKTISKQNVLDAQQRKSEDSPYGQIYSLPQLLERFNC